MSKLDLIILECANKVLDGKEEKLGDYIDPTKLQIKDVMLEIYTECREKARSEYDLDELFEQKVEAL